MKCTVIGHVTKDIILADGKTFERMGGGAYYSGLALSKFCRVELITSVGPDIPEKWIEELEGRFKLHTVPAERTTTFKLVYTSPNHRKLFLESLAGSLDDAVPKRRKMFVFNPVAGEISAEAVMSSRGYKFADVQGFVRKPSTGEVEFKRIDASFLDGLTAVHSDAVELKYLKGFRPSLSRVFIVSNGPEGGTVYVGGKELIFKPPEVVKGESTGAGDVFLGAFAGFYMKNGGADVIGALKMSIAFTTTFLKHRTVEFSLERIRDEAARVLLEQR